MVRCRPRPRGCLCPQLQNGAPVSWCFPAILHQRRKRNVPAFSRILLVPSLLSWLACLWLACTFPALAAPAAVSCGPSCSASAPSDSPIKIQAGGGMPGNFDFYVLALSWSPGFCETEAGARAGSQCEPGANLGFVVHGLWPQYEHGYPTDCGPAARFPSRMALEAAQGLYPSIGLARHEWLKHGTCSGKSPTDYFADVRHARDAIVIPAICRAQGRSDLDPRRYRACVHRRQSPASAGDAGRCLRGQCPGRGADLLFQGTARFSCLPGGQQAGLPRAGSLGASGAVIPEKSKNICVGAKGQAEPPT